LEARVGSRASLFLGHAIGAMKLLIEILLAIFLHPLAWVLCIINIVGRTDMGGVKKLIWIIVTFLWGVGPILYLLLADGSFW
jgi:uncharacterized RDD family membrane protein YckC